MPLTIDGRRLRGVLLVPAEVDPHFLMAASMCGSAPPQAGRDGARWESPGVFDCSMPWATGVGSIALVLAWNYMAVDEGIDRALRCLNRTYPMTEDGKRHWNLISEWPETNEVPRGLLIVARECEKQRLGTIILLDDAQREIDWSDLAPK